MITRAIVLLSLSASLSACQGFNGTQVLGGALVATAPAVQQAVPAAAPAQPVAPAAVAQSSEPAPVATQAPAGVSNATIPRQADDPAPFYEGGVWTYDELTSGAKTATITVRHSRHEVGAGFETVVVEREVTPLTGPASKGTDRLSKTSAGVTGQGSALLFKYPGTVGDVWLSASNPDATSRLVESEPVNAPYGRFTGAVKVVATPAGGQAVTSFYVKGVGLVRADWTAGADRVSQVLVSFSQ